MEWIASVGRSFGMGEDTAAAADANGQNVLPTATTAEYQGQVNGQPILHAGKCPWELRLLISCLI